MPAVWSAHLKCMSTHHLEGLEPLISIDELSDYLGVPVKTIYDWRLAGHGPCAIRVGRHLKYAISDVREWLATQRETVPGRAGSGE
jgi:excisionase family DNA binding protein